MNRPGSALQPVPPPDWHVLMAGVDQLREVVAAMVAGLVADGFSPEQARAIVTTAITGRQP